MQIKGKYSWAKHLDFMLIDLGALLLSFVSAYYFKFHTFAMNTGWQRFIVIVSLLNIVISLIVNPYSGIFRRRYYHDIGKTFLLVGINVLGAVLIFYVCKIGSDYSREVVINTYILYFLSAVILKYIWKKLLRSGTIKWQNAKKASLFLISSPEKAESDIHSILSTELPLYDIKGIHLVSDRGDAKTVTYEEENSTIAVPVIRDDVIEYILKNNISEVLVAVSPEKAGKELLQSLIANGVGVELVIEPLVGFQTEEQFVTNIGVNKALSIGMFSFSPSQNAYLLIKRLFDIICGVLGVIILIPISAAVKIAYLASGDSAKIFYRQKRVGQNGKLIRIWKFRSMVPNADEILQEMLKEEHYRKEWEENQKFENDPRITKVGSFVRKTSIDELPQLLNVLAGDMSLVGPRPLVEGELAAHGGLKLYEKVKPGITGWWGCNGRSNIDYHERLELEYYYVKNCSLYLDILCIIRTVFAVLKKDGAQ